MKRTLPLAVLASLTLAGTAHADTADDALAQVWPGHPCVGRIVVTYDATLADRGLDGQATGIDDSDPDNWVLRSCDIAIRPGLDPDRECDVRVHEALHLAFQRHSDEGVMRPDVGWWPACHPQPTRRQQAVEMVRGMLPARGWVVHCTPRVTRCRAMASWAKPRRFTVAGTTEWLQVSAL